MGVRRASFLYSISEGIKCIGHTLYVILNGALYKSLLAEGTHYVIEEGTQCVSLPRVYTVCYCRGYTMYFNAEGTRYMSLLRIYTVRHFRGQILFVIVKGIHCMPLQRQYIVHTVYATAKRLNKSSLFRLDFALIIFVEDVQTT